MCFSSGKTQPAFQQKQEFLSVLLKNKLKLAPAPPSDSPQNFLAARRRGALPQLPRHISIGEQRDTMEFFFLPPAQNTHTSIHILYAHTRTYTLLQTGVWLRHMPEKKRRKDRLTYFCHCLLILVRSAVAVSLADLKEKGMQKRADG